MRIMNEIKKQICKNAFQMQKFFKIAFLINMYVESARMIVGLFINKA